MKQGVSVVVSRGTFGGPVVKLRDPRLHLHTSRKLGLGEGWEQHDQSLILPFPPRQGWDMAEIPSPQLSVTLREDDHRKGSWGLKCGSTPVPVPPMSRGLTENFHVVVLCRLPQLVGDDTGVLAGIFLLGIQDL